MKTFLLFLSLCFGATMLHAEMRTWTSEVGTTQEAELVGYKMGSVLLRLPSGEIIEVRKRDLVDSDEEYVVETMGVEYAELEFDKYRPGQGNPFTSSVAQVKELLSGDMMQEKGQWILLALLWIGIVMGLCGYLMILGMAFGTSFIWGFVVLLVPFGNFAYGVTHWKRAKVPLILLCVGLLMMLSCAFILTLLNP